MIEVEKDEMINHINSRSRLYSLEPIGLRTEYAESLTSYLTRLSESHSVYVGSAE